MSNFDQLTQDSPDPQTVTIEGILLDISDVEKLIPKDLSRNKRAIVEKLIALYKTGER